MKRLTSALWILSGIMLLVAACQSPPPEAALEIDTLVVQVTPAARPVIPAVKACSAFLPNVDLRVVERFASQAEPGILIRLGEPKDDTSQLVRIASEEIGVILHPDSPAASLTVDQIRDLFTGQTASWADLGGADAAVTVWGLFAGDEAQQAFEGEILAGAPLASSAGLAPDPGALRGAVAADPVAIGLLPSAWVQDGVKFILVGVRLPVLFASDQLLEGPAADLAACLQGETGQTILNTIYP